ncbi:MAG: LacI family DNA-binding transcriptional regulator [Segetibacter sp.]
MNISVSTVSRALHDHSSIGLRTKMRVKQLAKELNYEPNQTAIFFQQGKTFTLGVILPELSEAFFLLQYLALRIQPIKVNIQFC